MTPLCIGAYASWALVFTTPHMTPAAVQQMMAERHVKQVCARQRKDCEPAAIGANAAFRFAVPNLTIKAECVPQPASKPR